MTKQNTIAASAAVSCSSLISLLTYTTVWNAEVSCLLLPVRTFDIDIAIDINKQ